MEKLKRLQKKLTAAGFDAKFITVYNYKGTGEDVQALRIDTNYEGPYPTRETFAAIDSIRNICKNHATECRGYYSGVFVY